MKERIAMPVIFSASAAFSSSCATALDKDYHDYCDYRDYLDDFDYLDLLEIRKKSMTDSLVKTYFVRYN